MKIAMMWLDNDPNLLLSQKIVKAMVYHAKKYGELPNLCYVHPSTSIDDKDVGVVVKTAEYILPNTLWIGVSSNGNVGVS